MTIAAMKLALETLEGFIPYLPLDDEAQCGRYNRAITALSIAIEQAEKQEPVAWITDGGKGELWWYQSSKFDEEGNLIGNNPDDIPLYEAPPMRQWQGLTDEEIQTAWESMNHDPAAFVHFAGGALWAEAKCKEKNG